MTRGTTELTVPALARHGVRASVRPHLVVKTKAVGHPPVDRCPRLNRFLPLRSPPLFGRGRERWRWFSFVVVDEHQRQAWRRGGRLYRVEADALHGAPMRSLFLGLVVGFPMYALHLHAAVQAMRAVWFCRRQRRNPASSSRRLTASGSCPCADSGDAKQRFSILSGILNNTFHSFRIG